MERASLLFCACVALLTTGCASIVSSKNYPVSINSDPQGATVVVTDKSGREVFRGQTPTRTMLAAGDGYFSSARYRFAFEKPGYGSATTMLSANLDGWYIGNILFGGIIGFLIVDPLTGCMWKLNEYVHANLTKGAAGEAVAAPPPAPVGMGMGSNASDDEGGDELSRDLRRLKRLHSEGVLTDDEYARKRQEVIDKWEP